MVMIFSYLPALYLTISHLNEGAQSGIGWIVCDQKAHAFVADFNRSRSVHPGHVREPATLWAEPVSCG